VLKKTKKEDNAIKTGVMILFFIQNYYIIWLK